MDNAITCSYIRHGDFLSEGKGEKITIDASWIPSDKVAIAWYDRVISEVSNALAATSVLKKKLHTQSVGKKRENTEISMASSLCSTTLAHCYKSSRYWNRLFPMNQIYSTFAI